LNDDGASVPRLGERIDSNRPDLHETELGRNEKAVQDDEDCGGQELPEEGGVLHATLSLAPIGQYQDLELNVEAGPILDACE